MPSAQTCLGLVSRAATWPQRVEAWSSAGHVPILVSYCTSVAHLQARLRAEHGPGIALLDGDLSFVDRDLLAGIAADGGRAVIVEGPRRHQDWSELGAGHVLPADFDQAQLLEAVGIVPTAAPAPSEQAVAPLVAVTGPGGTGASVTAIALAQGLAADRRRVLLADCCLHAEQAMLHNAHGAQPCLTDVVDLHAHRTPERRQVRQHALGIVERGYYLLPGLPRARQWSRVRGGSLQQALGSLRGAFDVVVADVDPDVEGEAEGGSIEVEERNVLSRTVLSSADAVLVVGHPTMKGVYALVRAMIELLEFGVRPQRLLPVINQAGTSQSVRAELSRAVRHLIDGVAGGQAVGPVLFAPRVALEEPLRERDAVSPTWSSLLADTTTVVLDRARGPASEHGLVRVTPGSVGHWDDPDEAQ
jgi:cellulose biosynthesis protein BcsQ